MGNPERFPHMPRGFDLAQAIAEADRCLLCHDAPCSRGCPAETDPGTFIRKLRLRDVTGAIRTIKTNNALGGACGVLCPAPRLCEKECSATGIGRPIEIGRIQRALVEHGWKIGFRPFAPTSPVRGQVAVVGSGPAGLSCAAELAREGFEVTVFEERDEPGGVIRYGVPAWRFDREFLARELADLERLGVKLACATRIDGAAGAEKLLREGFKAVFLAPGLWASDRIPGADGTRGVYTSVEFLALLRREELTELGTQVAGARVAVIGGGSVAMDCAESALRLGARDVWLVYRRSFAQMPAEEEERIAALRLGVHFLVLNQPVGYLGDATGRLTGLRLVRTRLGEVDPSGRRKPEEIQGSEWTLEAEVAVEAIGNRPDTTDWASMVKTDRGGLIVTDRTTGRTSAKSVYAGGDIARGPSLVVHAVQDGKLAARAIGAMEESAARPQAPVPDRVDLSVRFCGVRFRNPFLLSSSPVSNSAEMVEKAYEQGWAGVCFKTLNADRIPIVHPSPRMNAYHYESRRLVGLQNVEQISDRPLKDNLADFLSLKKKYPDHPLIASIMGFSNDEWAFLAKAAEDNGADMIELNFSCPHMTVEGSGHKVGQALPLLEKFTATVKAAVSIPVLAKMTPNITDMTEPALFAKKGGADGISAVNTFRAISGIGLDDWVAKPNVFGVGAVSGYSGAAIKPIALRFIAEMAQCAALGLPLSAMGGVETWIDALEYLLVGATTVQATTGVIKYGYRIVQDMIEGLTDYMTSRGISRAEEMIGKALPTLRTTDHFDLNRQGIAAYDMDRCVGCGQCYIVCRDAGGQALDWDGEKRRPKLVEDKCLGCMICSFVCPVPDLVGFREMPAGWKRRPTAVMDRGLERQVKIPPGPRV